MKFQLVMIICLGKFNAKMECFVDLIPQGRAKNYIIVFKKEEGPKKPFLKLHGWVGCAALLNNYIHIGGIFYRVTQFH
jgi:hypothetical protein